MRHPPIDEIFNFKGSYDTVMEMLTKDIVNFYFVVINAILPS